MQHTHTHTHTFVPHEHTDFLVFIVIDELSHNRRTIYFYQTKLSIACVEANLIKNIMRTNSTNCSLTHSLPLNDIFDFVRLSFSFVFVSE